MEKMAVIKSNSHSTDYFMRVREEYVDVICAEHEEAGRL
jgi:hypothetical protein